MLFDLAARATRGASHDVATVEQSQRQLEGREVRRQQPREERREVRAQGQQLAVAIRETVELAARSSLQERLVGCEVVDHRQDGLAKPPRFELVREPGLESAQARRRVEEERRDPCRQSGREPHAIPTSSPSTRRPSSTGRLLPVIARNCGIAW